MTEPLESALRGLREIKHGNVPWAKLCNADARALLAEIERLRAAARRDVGVRAAGWKWLHEYQAELLARDGLMCEQHPGTEFPHDDCAGPGMPWLLEGREAITSVTGQLANARSVIHRLVAEVDLLRRARDRQHPMDDVALRYLEGENKRLSAAIRETHAECIAAGLETRHLPACKLYEIDE